MKRPAIRLPEISPELRKELLITGGFALGQLLIAIGVGLVSVPAGLVYAGAALSGMCVVAARRLG